MYLTARDRVQHSWHHVTSASDRIFVGCSIPNIVKFASAFHVLALNAALTFSANSPTNVTRSTISISIFHLTLFQGSQFHQTSSNIISKTICNDQNLNISRFSESISVNRCSLLIWATGYKVENQIVRSSHQTTHSKPHFFFPASASVLYLFSFFILSANRATANGF